MAEAESLKAKLAEAESAVPESAKTELNQLRETVESQKTALQEIESLKSKLAEAETAVPIAVETELKQLRDAASEKDKLKAEVATLKAQNEESASGVTEEITKLKESLAAKEKEIELAEVAVPQSVQAELDELRAAAAKPNEAELKLKETNAHAEKLEGRAQDAETKLGALNEEVKSLRDSVASSESAFQQRLAKHEEEVTAKFASDIEVTGKRLEDQNREIETLRQKNISLVADLESTQAESKQLKTDLESRPVVNVDDYERRLRNFETDNQALKSKFSDAEKALAKERAEKAEAVKDAEEKRRSISQLQLAMQKTQREMNFVQTKSDSDNQKLEDAKDLKTKLADHSKEISTLRKQLASAEKKSEKTAAEKMKVAETVAQLKQELKDQKKAATKLTSDNKKFERKIGQLETAAEKAQQAVADAKLKASEAKKAAADAKKQASAAKKSTTKKSTTTKANSKSTPKKSKSTSGDALQMIDGIGPTYEKKLRAAGITTFAKIAKWTKKDIAKYTETLGLRSIEEDNWVGQAKKLKVKK